MATDPKVKKVSATDASRLIDERIRDLTGWRGDTLARMRALIRDAVPAAVEEWKWSNPVWSHAGILCTGEAYKSVVKLTFPRGAHVPDPSRLFNSSLEGNTRRAIDIREGEQVNARAFKALLKAAAKLNAGSAKQPRASTTSDKPRTREAKPAAGKVKPVKLLSGGNPQIAKADGDAPVQAYIAALSGWQRESAQRLDALVVRTVPEVQKAVKWNSPFYGKAGDGWFLVLHTYTKFLQLTFFRGTSLRPMPAQASKVAEVRYHRIVEGGFDETQLRRWIKQAAALPGWVP
jgi:hypothetical protein